MSDWTENTLMLMYEHGYSVNVSFRQVNAFETDVLTVFANSSWTAVASGAVLKGGNGNKSGL